MIRGVVAVVARDGSRAEAAGDFVADGTNDQDTIMKAMDHVASTGNGRGTVMVASGTYNTSHPVFMLHDGVHLEHEPGAEYVLVPTWMPSLSPYDPTRTVDSAIALMGVREASVVGASLSPGQVNCLGISALPKRLIVTPQDDGEPCEEVRISENIVRGAFSHVYLIWNFRGRGVTIDNNLVLGGMADFCVPSLANGIETYGGHRVSIRDNRIYGVGSGVVLTTAGNPTTGCDLKDVLVQGNQLDFCNRAIYLSASQDPVNGPQHVRAVHISANQARRIAQWGYIGEANGSQLLCDDFRFVHNSISLAGIGPETPQVERALPGRAPFSSVFWVGKTTDIVVEGNDLRGTADGHFNALFTLDGAGDTSVRGNAVISDDEVPSSQRGMRLSRCVDFDASNNRVRGAALSAVELIDSHRGDFTANDIREWNLTAQGRPGVEVYVASDVQLNDSRFVTSSLSTVPALIRRSGALARVSGAGNRYLGAEYTGPIMM